MYKGADEKTRRPGYGMWPPEEALTRDESLSVENARLGMLTLSPVLSSPQNGTER